MTAPSAEKPRRVTLTCEGCGSAGDADAAEASAIPKGAMILCPECHKIVDTFWVAANKCANALMGPLMKKTNGMADPVVAKRLMLERLMEE